MYIQMDLATLNYIKFELNYLRHLKDDYADQSCQSMQNNIYFCVLFFVLLIVFY